jgi:TRAP-type C4-dicarboxylate transport system substrate-binding protein
LVPVGNAAWAREPSTANIRIATLAPKHSPWGKVFSAWAKAVDNKTSGTVEVQWLWNGTAGPDRARDALKGDFDTAR